MLDRARKRLSKRAKRGFRGWPLATVALYGPDDTQATKLAVGIVPSEGVEATELRRWFSKETDIRRDAAVAEEVLAFIETSGAKTVVDDRPHHRLPTRRGHRLRGCDLSPLFVLGRPRPLDRQALTLAPRSCATSTRNCGTQPSRTACKGGSPAPEFLLWFADLMKMCAPD